MTRDRPAVDPRKTPDKVSAGEILTIVLFRDGTRDAGTVLEEGESGTVGQRDSSFLKLYVRTRAGEFIETTVTLSHCHTFDLLHALLTTVCSYPKTVQFLRFSRPNHFVSFSWVSRGSAAGLSRVVRVATLFQKCTIFKNFPTCRTYK